MCSMYSSLCSHFEIKPWPPNQGLALIGISRRDIQRSTCSKGINHGLSRTAPDIQRIKFMVHTVDGESQYYRKIN